MTNSISANLGCLCPSWHIVYGSSPLTPRLDENIRPGKYLPLTGSYHLQTAQNLSAPGAAKILRRATQS